MFNKNKKKFAPFSTDKILKENVCGIVVESWLKGKALEFLSCRDAYNSVVYGSPGTGKSIVAINVLGYLNNIDKTMKDKVNTCYCSANFTPRALYSELLVNDDYHRKVIDNLFKTEGSFSKSGMYDYDCILVDEAHRAMEWRFGYGVKKDVDFVDKIFYASRVNVFFIDENQTVSKYDYLTIDKIKKYAKKYQSELIDNEDLTLCNQYRCMGGEWYISFVDYLLGFSFVKPFKKANNYDLRVFDSPTEMWNQISSLQKEYPFSRIISGYTHDWLSKHDDTKYDFIMDNGSFKMKWNKYVMRSYINDKSQTDRIGCIHTIQGVDLDYAGVIIGKDLIYRNGKLLFDKTANAKTDDFSGIRNADDETAKTRIRNTYKVLLTRGVRGTFIYCEDKELNDFIKQLLK